MSCRHTRSRVRSARSRGAQHATIEEDSIAASFAGIHITRLNLCTADEVIKALREIEVSAGSSRAVEYRKARRHVGTFALAAMVQSFVPSDVSGILFTRDPLNGADRIIIEASWGLGQSVVDGRVTPDRWVLSQDKHVISVTVSDKTVAIVPDKKGVKEIAVDASRRTIPCLTSHRLTTLLDLGRVCEEILGHPQDIEWAIAEGHVWILQSRPITTL